MKERKKLGEMLIEGGLLTQDQLQEALLAHKNYNMKLGQYLVKQGIITELQLVDYLSQQLKLTRYHPDKYALNVKLTETIPAETARKARGIPLKKRGNLLTVAMVDPMDIEALDTLEEATSYEVEPIICTEQEYNQLLASFYGSFSDQKEVFESTARTKFEKKTKTEKKVPLPDEDSNSLEDKAGGAPVVRLVNSILTRAIQEGASDIHISPERDDVQVRYRIDGRLHEVQAPPKNLFLPVVSRIKILANMDISVSRIPQDGRFSIEFQEKEINIRASTIPTINGENVVLRLLNTGAGIYSLDDLGMVKSDRKKIQSMITKPYGMCLSTGPTGSGKSTSLYAILKKINKEDINIITIEDPVEYRIDKIRQIQLNRKAGMTFASGLKSILRQDPDVVMVGEIRDPETASIAVQAALTGHRVFSTVHTNDAAGAITRFLDMGIEPFLISSVMLLSFAQRLVRKVCPQCKEPYNPPEDILKQWGLSNVVDAHFQRGKGCLHCMNTGYKGRTGIFEVLIIDQMIQDMILKRKSAQSITRAAQEDGRLRTLKVDAAHKAAAGITTLEEAAYAVLT